jgi:hypothetical protein
MRLIFLIALALPAFAQVRFPGVTIYPTSNDVSTGQLQFLTRRSDGNSIQIQAPLTGASYTLTLPTAAPANNGDCLVSTTAGVLSFATCSGAGGIWTASGGDVYRATGSVTVGSATPDAKFGVISAINDGISVTDGTTRGIIYSSSAATNSLVVGTTTNHPVLFWANNTEALRLSPGGALLTRSHITTVSPSAADIGDATNYFQTLYIENIDAAPGGVAAAYTKVRKLEIADILGGTAFWDQRANATSVTSAWTLRDNGGSRALQAVRQEVSSPANYLRAYGDFLPALRATADGDAVNDSTLPTLGNTSARWSAIWGDAATITNVLTAGSATAGTITATTAFSAGLDNVTPIGSSSVRLSKVWTYDLSATGTIQLKSSSTSGHVWTATDSSGNGGWAAGSCAGCLLLTGGTINGGINAGIKVTDGTASALFWASSISTNSIVIGTDSLHDLILFGHNGERARLTSTGMTVTGTLAVSGITTLSGDLRFGADNTQAIGQTGTRPSVVYSRVDNTAKLEVQDLSGGFWDQRVNATGTTSNWILRDNAGSRALAYTRVFSSSPDNSFEVFGALLPAQRATGSGDAVNDSTPPSIGATARRWTALWADAATVTNTLAATTVNATTVSSTNIDGGVLTATTSLLPDVDNGAVIGGSSLRFTKLWAYDIDAAGTVKLGTSSTVGQVWTASDTAGNGGWATPGSSQWTTSGSDIYYSTGRVTVGSATPDTILTVRGGTNDGVAITDGTARGIMFASSALTNSIVFGTTSAHPLAVYAGNALHTAFWPSGNTCIGCTNDANKLEVTGNTLLTGNLTFTGTLNTAISTTELSYLDGVTSAIQTQLDARVTLSTNQTISGTKTFTSSLLFTTDNTHTVGAAATAPSVVYGRIVSTRKAEITDTSGGTAFWDQRVNASGTSSDWALRDNAGSRMIRGVRNVGGSPVNYFEVFADLRPAKRSTGGGDAVNDTPYPGLGNTTDRWASIWGDAITVTNGVTAASVATGSISVSAGITGALDGVTTIGASSVRMSKLWAYDIDASGTIRFPTGAVNGYCWKSDASGNGSWGVCGGSGTVTSIATSGPISGGTITGSGTISCPTCFTTSGGSVSGSISPNTDLAFNLGSSSFRWNNAYLDFIYLYSGFLAPNGNFGATTTLTCGAGQAVKNITISGGVVTSASCGAP